jgi:hypothetical protein
LHTRGLQDLLDQYSQRVGRRHGMTRGDGRRRGRRIQSRTIFRALEAARNFALRFQELELLSLVNCALGIKESPEESLLRNSPSAVARTSSGAFQNSGFSDSTARDTHPRAT